MEEAQKTVKQLRTVVDKSYQDLSKRLEAMELLQVEQSSLLFRLSKINEDSTSEVKLSQPWRRPQFTFEKALKKSRVYKRVEWTESLSSCLTKDSHNTNWSMLSDLSLADVSNISVISLAITVGEVYNSIQYYSDGNAKNDFPGAKWLRSSTTIAFNSYAYDMYVKNVYTLRGYLTAQLA